MKVLLIHLQIMLLLRTGCISNKKVSLQVIDLKGKNKLIFSIVFKSLPLANIWLMTYNLSLHVCSTFRIQETMH